MKRNRRILQVAFLALVVTAVFIVRGNAEAWCPFGGVEAAYAYFHDGKMLCSLAITNFYILGAVLLSVVLLRRAFCSYACPIGAISEFLQVLGAKLGLGKRTKKGTRPLRVPPKLDFVLGLLKYVVLGVILYFTWKTTELVFRGYDICWALLGRHGEDITHWAYIIAGATVVASLFLTIPFCRWFCPLAAVMAPFSKLGVMSVHKNDDACSGCGKCSEVCPMAIDVEHEGETVTAARCTSCLSCVQACPTTKKGVALTWGTKKRPWSQGFLIGVLLACFGGAVLASELLDLPSYVEDRGVVAESPASVDLEVHDLGCRGRGALLWYFLDRDDYPFSLPGHLRVEAWPGPGLSLVRVHYDAALTDADAVRFALTEPYYDNVEHRWRSSPFLIEGFDALDMGDLPTD